jgi:predicted RNA-binding Zn-ribbon protein involved in translation (DUF1610 family)
MPISFSCLKCGKKLKAPDNAAGKSSRCPGCGATVTCPEPIYDAELVESPGAESGGLDPYGDLDSDKPYAVAGATPSEATASRTEDRRPCPMCGEMIMTAAAKCRYCGEIFDPTLKKAKSKKKHGAEAEDLSTGDWVVALLCSGIGCIAGIVWMIQGKPKGLKMTGISIAMAIFWTFVRFALLSQVQNGGVR